MLQLQREREEQKRLEEEEEIKRLRKEMTFKAQPIRKFKNSGY